jgi:hypothetical protein
MKLKLAPYGGIPTGLKCSDCGRTIKEGQACFQHSVRNVGHFAWHASCIQTQLDEGPEDLDNTIMEEYEALRVSFDREGALV